MIYNLGTHLNKVGLGGQAPPGSSPPPVSVTNKGRQDTWGAKSGQIALVQEPHMHKGKITNFDREFKIYTGDGENVRTGIIVSNNLQVWKLNQFCDSDQTVIVTSFNGKPLVWVSLYLPYDDAEPPPHPYLRT